MSAVELTKKVRLKDEISNADTLFEWWDEKNPLLLYHPVTNSLIEFNNTAARILNMCDGRPIAAIVEEMRELYPSISSIESDVMDFLHQLRETEVVVFE